MGQLYAITPFTLLDYPGEMACIAWFAGCNLRCAYCHNPDIVLGRGEKDESAFLDFLRRRRGMLTAAVFSGGEATFCPSLPILMRHAKGMGYKTKLDTNGTRPTVIMRLLKEGLLDYVALDYKCPASRSKELLGTTKYCEMFNSSLTQLISCAQQGLGLEVRTTYHPDLMTEDDLTAIIHDLDARGFKGNYYIQNIASHGDKTLGRISEPSSQQAPDNLPKPKNFTLSFRNFATTN